MREENADKPDGTILQELQKGYMVKGKTIRPSMVKVSFQ
jgi:molecular chaperone GrpE